MSWFLTAFKKYAVFSGRARRKEYWFFGLFSMIFALILTGIDAIIGTLDLQAGLGLLGGIFNLAIILPSIAVSVRRLHDTGRSGWWFLIAFIPLIGIIVLMIFFFQDSEPNENKYGPNPKMVSA